MKVELVVESGSPHSDSLAIRKLLQDYSPGAEYPIMLKESHILIKVQKDDFPALKKYLRANTFPVVEYPLEGSPDVVFRNEISNG
jgi:hypothetical protein